MNPFLTALTPVAIWQGRRQIGGMLQLEPPTDLHGLAVPASGGAVGTADRQHLVVLGDSTAAGYGASSLAEGLPGTLAQLVADRRGREVVWQVVGEHGASTLRVHHRMLERLPARADLVVLCVGMNDLIARHSVAEWRDEMSAILDLLARHGQVVVCGAPPVASCPSLGWPLSAQLDATAAAYDRVTEQLCAERGMVFAPVRHLQLGPDDFAADGFHPSTSGYQLWARAVAEVLDRA